VAFRQVFLLLLVSLLALGQLLCVIALLALVISEVLLVPLPQLISYSLHLCLMVLLFRVSFVNHSLELFRKLEFGLLELCGLFLKFQPVFSLQTL